MKKIWLIIYSALFCLNLYSQIEPLNLDNDPQIAELTDAEKKEEGVILVDHRVIEFTFSNQGEKAMNTTVHKRIHINSDKGIAEFNKVAIPMREGSKLVSLVARAISKDNQIILLDQNNIKEVKNLTDFGSYKIFAIEGLEVGGELEFLYTVKSSVLFSDNEVFQTNVKVKKAVFDIYYPRKIVVQARSYNGFPSMSFTQILNSPVSKLSAEISDIPAHVKVEYETHEANLMKVEFVIKQIRDQFGSLEDAYTWRNVIKRYNTLIFSNVKGEAKVANLLRNLKISDLPNDDQKIIEIEKFIKNSIKYKNSNSPELSDLKTIINNKYGNELGLTKLYATCFTLANIKFRLMATSNRYYNLFDKAFVTNSSMSHFIYYFPDYDKYISPLSFEYRFGMAPYMYESNEGVMIDNMGVTDVAFHKIKTADTAQNYTNKTVSIEFPGQLDQVIVNGTINFKGQRAIRLRGSLFFSSDKEKNEMFKNLASSEDPDAEILETKFTNQELDKSFSNEDLIFSYKKKSNSLIEKANDNILFNVGKIIGKQSELYQETERTVPIDMSHPLQYNYKIKFTIPDGYSIKNLEDLKTNQVLLEENVPTARFHSDYVTNNKDVTIIISEYYVKSYYDISTYRDFRKVINAASDFSKIILVLEKNQNTAVK